MKLERLKEKDNEIAIVTNKFISISCIVAILGFVILGVLNLLGVFILDKKNFSIVSIVGMVLMSIPLIVVQIFKQDKKYVKYLIVSIVGIIVGVLYSVVSVHIVLGLVFPIMFAAAYMDKKLLIYSVFVTEIAVWVSHYLAPMYTITFDEPLPTFKSSLLFGALPRTILLSCVVFLAYKIVQLTGKTVRSVEVLSKDVMYNKNVLKRFIKGSRKIARSNTTETRMKNIGICAKSVTGYMNDIGKINRAIVGMAKNDLSFIFMDEDKLSENIKSNLYDGNIFVYLKKDIQIPIYSEREDNFYRQDDDYLIMAFYNDNLLYCFIVLEVDTKADKFIENNIMKIFYNTLKLDLINARLTEDKKKNQVELIRAFAEISESKSCQTGKHVKRVSEYMKVFGKHICNNEDECESLSIASMLHDVGKLMVPSAILDKPGKLTKEEFNIIKQHTEFGGKLLEGIPSQIMMMARQIAVNHHERWDGSGYHGKKGEEIEFYSRYVSVIDVFDALVSKRSYKDAWGISEAYEEIVKNKGTQFAPEAVELFEKCYDELIEVYKLYPDSEK